MLLQLILIDVIKNSESYGCAESFTLSEEENVSILVPESCSVGHLILSERAMFHYLQSSSYGFHKQFTLTYRDPSVNNLFLETPTIVSDRDKSGLLLEEINWNSSYQKLARAWGLGGDAYGPVADEEALDALKTAYEKGINFIDTSDLYGNGKSEKMIGKFLKNYQIRIRRNCIYHQKVDVCRIEVSNASKLHFWLFEKCIRCIFK